MLNIKAHLFDDCVHFVIQHGCGDVYTRDPHQAVPPDCGFVRGRYPGATLFTSAGIVTLRTRRGMSTPQLDDWCTIATFVAGMQQMKPAPCGIFYLMHALWTKVLSPMGFFESVGVCTSLHGWYPMCGVAPETEMDGSTPTTRQEYMTQPHYTWRATMTEHNAVTGIYPTHSEAEAAVKALQRAGFDMQKLSIVGKDYHTEEHVIGYYNTGDRMQFWGKRGAFWGGFWGLLFGSGFFFIPGIGPLMVFGPLVGWIIGALEGAVVVGGLSALGAGLYSLGIPKNSVVEYETALKSDNFLVMAHGTLDEVAQAKHILETTGAAQVAAHQSADTSTRGAAVSSSV